MINYCKTLLSGQGADLRLKNGATNVQSFTYDATGNRLSKTLATTTTSSTYPATSHRLSNDGTSARTYDANGNTATLAAKSFVYDDRNRLRDYINSGTTVTRTYRYNGKGERVSKVQSATSTNNRYYFYDEAGHLLGEYLANGTRVQEYVWLDDQLIGVLSDHDTSTYQFVETDHLGTPRAVIHPAQNKIIWRWNITNTAFGEHAATNDPDANTIAYTFNHRYPGQQADAESGLNYNYFRDYEPQTGRYVQSDPIGLDGGISTFGYVEAAPLNFVDPTGLQTYLPIPTDAFGARQAMTRLRAPAKCRLSPKARKCMAKVFGVSETDVDDVNIQADSVYARAHFPEISGHMMGLSLSFGNGSTTRPGRIMTSLSCGRFEKADGYAHSTHEYFHIFRQWGNGRMTMASYLAGFPVWEAEANGFAAANKDKLKSCINGECQ
jgi:RHS repeat-associated protein